jgi:hypothetical protein
MADGNNSAVSIVAIIAIIILVGGGLYFMWVQRGAEEQPLIDVDIQEELPLSEPLNPPLKIPIGTVIV